MIEAKRKGTEMWVVKLTSEEQKKEMKRKKSNLRRRKEKI